MTSNQLIFKQPNPKDLDERFKFVKNKVLRQNISNTLSYIIFLGSLEKIINLPTLYKNQTYKTIIIYSAAIVESLLHYKLKSLIESGRVRESKIFKKEFKYDELSKVILNDELGVDLPIVLCKKADIEKHLKDNTQFHDMIIAGKRCRLLTPTLFKYCNEIKDLRNNIHMASMMEVDDKYTKVKVNNIYRKVKKVIDRIESY